MGLFRRRGKGGDHKLPGNYNDTGASDYNEEAGLTEEQEEAVQDVIKDNLTLMNEVVMRIREDPEFAKDMYKDCPRLQHLLDQYPDLRHVFSDPKMVRVNFEQVYREAGGVLPEDEEKQVSWFVWFANSPIFKVLKLLLFIKKAMACVAGGGFAFASGMLMGCCFEDVMEEIGDGGDDDGGDVDDDGNDLNMDPNKEALYRAADYMEDPEVQERMQGLLEQDPEELQDSIENDEELRALRDSNPMCEELMKDPETMKVLTDPDNLRALGDAPDLIGADFLDPDGFDSGAFDDAPGMEEGYDVFDGVENDGDMGDMDDDYDDDMDYDDEEPPEEDFEDEGGGEEEEEDGGGFFEDVELEEQEIEADDNNGNTSNSKSAKTAKAAKGGAKGGAQTAAEQGAEVAKTNKFSGIMASIGAAATDLIAAHIVGSVLGDMEMPGGDGGGLDALEGGDGMDDVGDAVDQGGDIADEAGDVADVAEETADAAEEKKEIDESKRSGADDASSAGASVDANVVIIDDDHKVVDGKKMRRVKKEELPEDEEEEEKPKRFGKISVFFGKIGTEVKNTFATAILGDDWGEALVERMEEEDEEDEEEGSEWETDTEGEEHDEEKGKGVPEEAAPKKSKRRWFARKSKEVNKED